MKALHQTAVFTIVAFLLVILDEAAAISKRQEVLPGVERFCTSTCGLRDTGSYPEQQRQQAKSAGGSRGRFSIVSMLDSSIRRRPQSRASGFGAMAGGQNGGLYDKRGADTKALCKLCKTHGFTE